jgi:hypothetical protein
MSSRGRKELRSERLRFAVQLVINTKCGVNSAYWILHVSKVLPALISPMLKKVLG